MCDVDKYGYNSLCLQKILPGCSKGNPSNNNLRLASKVGLLFLSRAVVLPTCRFMRHDEAGSVPRTLSAGSAACQQRQFWSLLLPKVTSVRIKILLLSKAKPNGSSGTPTPTKMQKILSTFGIQKYLQPVGASRLFPNLCKHLYKDINYRYPVMPVQSL